MTILIMAMPLWYKYARNVSEIFQNCEGLQTPVSKLLKTSDEGGGLQKQPKLFFENNRLQRVESQRTSLT